MWIIEIDNMRIIHQNAVLLSPENSLNSFKYTCVVHLGQTNIPKISDCQHMTMLLYAILLYSTNSL